MDRVVEWDKGSFGPKLKIRLKLCQHVEVHYAQNSLENGNF